jgi:hypothetical protein
MQQVPSQPLPSRGHRSAARIRLDETVANIELTLISIVQGLALGVLANAAVDPIVGLQWQAWPYIATGLVLILIFWSRALLHTLSFIGWPLEFGHTFLYFASTLIEAAALTQVAVPAHWYALNALYAACVWCLYAWDLRLVRQQAGDFRTPGERALLADILADQRLNIRWMTPATVVFQALCWWLVLRHPAAMLGQGWHLLAIGLSLAFSLHYLHGGMRMLRRRQDWIVERHAQERAEA